MKQPWFHYPNLCATEIRYQNSPKVDINLQYHSPIVDINENPQSIPTIH